MCVVDSVDALLLCDSDTRQFQAGLHSLWAWQKPYAQIQAQEESSFNHDRDIQDPQNETSRVLTALGRPCSKSRGSRPSSSQRSHVTKASVKRIVQRHQSPCHEVPVVVKGDPRPIIRGKMTLTRLIQEHVGPASLKGQWDPLSNSRVAFRALVPKYHHY